MPVAVAILLKPNLPISINNYIFKLIKEFIKKYESYDINLQIIYGSKIYHLDNNFNLEKLIKNDNLKSYSINQKNLKSFKNFKNIILHIPYLGRTAPSLKLFFKNFKSFNKIIVTNHGMAHLAIGYKLCYQKDFIGMIFDSFSYIKWKLLKNKIDLLITVSNSEKKNISTKLNIPGEKIKVIYHGVDHEIFRPLNKNDVFQKLIERYGINFDYILHVSSYQPKKNVVGLIKAFSVLKNKYNIKEKLIIVGKMPQFLKQLVVKLGLEDSVLFLGYLPVEDLAMFYNAAKVFVFPSFHESFGMPILEAMACGCPVITSNVFSMPEIAGDAALLINPYDINDIVKAISAVVTDQELRRKLQKKGLKRSKSFTWEKCAEEHLKVYMEVIE